MTTTVSAPSRPVNGFDPDELDGDIAKQIGQLTDARIKLATFRRRIAQLARANEWPESATLSIDSWSLSNRSISVRIKHDPDRKWRGLNGTAGIVFRIRKFFNCSHLRRIKIGYNVSDPQTMFTAHVQIDPDDPNSTYYVTITCEGEIPDMCHLEEVIDTTPRKSYKIVCGPAIQAAIGDPVPAGSLQETLDVIAASQQPSDPS